MWNSGALPVILITKVLPASKSLKCQLDNVQMIFRDQESAGLLTVRTSLTFLLRGLRFLPKKIIQAGTMPAQGVVGRHKPEGKGWVKRNRQPLFSEGETMK